MPDKIKTAEEMRQVVILLACDAIKVMALLGDTFGPLALKALVLTLEGDNFTQHVEGYVKPEEKVA